jgi:hypothetical protein
MLCTSLFIGISAQADTYVSTSGSDSNPGTLAAPFATIQHAVDQMSPGETCYIRGGSYHETVDLSGVAGTEVSPITLTPYDDEEVIMDGRVEIETTWTLEERASVSLPDGNDTPSANIPGIGNVYVTTIDSSIGDITQLFVEDEIMTLARWPNALAYSDGVFLRGETQTLKYSDTHGEATDSASPFSLADTGVSVADCVGIFGSVRLITDHSAGSADFSHNTPCTLEDGTTYYFIEGGLNNAERVLLDSEQEWAYDESTQTLTFWPEDDENPNALNLYARNQANAFTGTATTKYVVIDGLDFFATKLAFDYSDYITIQNCDFTYYPNSERALGVEWNSETADFSGDSSDFCENITVYNCAFRYADGTGFSAHHIDGLTFENNLIYKTGYYTCNEWDELGERRNTHAFHAYKSKDIHYRRNTVDTTGTSQSVCFARYGTSSPEYPIVAEYNFNTECCGLQTDVSSMYIAEEDVHESVARFNWFIDNYRRDFRWDGANIDEVLTARGNFYRNVGMSEYVAKHGWRLKGDYHEVYNSMTINDDWTFDIADGKGGNANTESRNNAADVFTCVVEEEVYPDYFEADGPWEAGEAYDRAQYDWGIPGDDANNYSPSFVAYTRSMHELLKDPDNWDFRPRADAVELIDQGTEVTCTVDDVEIDITEGFLGDAPDIGVYEYGDTTYWIAGRQEEQASMPVPKMDGEDVPLDADLMYLIGLDGVSANIYFGKSPYALSFLTSKTDPENIVTLSDYTTLNNETTYYWRVDTVLTDGTVITGDVWSFETDMEEEILPWTSSSIVGAYWEEDAESGDLVFINDGTLYTRRAIAYSSDTYQSDTGFRLTVYYTAGSIADVTAHNFSFGLISTDTDLSAYDGFNPFKIDTSVYSLGVNLTANGDDSAQGLNFTDGSTCTTLDQSGDNEQFEVGESTEVIIEIHPDGAWSYSINGITEASGVIDDGFDVTKSYRVAVYGQDDNGGEKSIQHMVLDNLPEGLIADWSMDESSGEDVFDSSGYGFDASIFNSERGSGLTGNAVEFNGSDSSLILPPEAFADVSDEITVAMWIYGDTTQPRSDTVFNAIDSSGNRVLNIHLPWRDQTVYWDAGNTETTYDRITKVASTASDYMSQWNHWVFTKNATTGSMEIYLNGSLWHSGTGMTKSMGDITYASLGNSVVGGSSYDGLIDEVKLYNVSLDATEVSDLYDSCTVINDVPVAWLVSYGIDPTDAGALADTDGDGIANWQEYQNGTDPLVLDNPAGIRVTEYYLTTGDFTETSKTLVLDQDLADDYFILVRGSRDGDGDSLPDNDYARVTGVPWGGNLYAGDMVGSGNNNQIILTRSVATYDWEGVVTVVECTNPSSDAGFDLVDIASVDISGNSGSEVGIAWSDINQVVLFGGYRGGGVSYTGTPTSGYDNVSAYTRFYPSGSDTIEWTRNSAGETLLDVTATTFVVEWGSEWNVQHSKVTGSNGGDGANATAEYTTVAIDSISRDNTWVWGTGTRLDSGVGDGAEGCLVTLGDGVNQNATESTVAVGSEYTDTYWFDVYTMTHPDLNVDHRFKADGDSGSLDLAVTVDSAASGTRFGWVYNGCNGTGTSVSRAKLWSRYTNDNEVTISRGNSGQNFPAWVQGVDFSGLNE